MATMVANNMSIKYFDTLEYVRKSKELKDPEALAEYQVKQMESAIETAVQYVKNETSNNVKDLATKSDLKNDISGLRYDTLKFIIWTGVGVVITLGGMIAHGFHWI